MLKSHRNFTTALYIGYPKLRYFSEFFSFHLNRMTALVLFQDILRENKDKPPSHH